MCQCAWRWGGVRLFKSLLILVILIVVIDVVIRLSSHLNIQTQGDTRLLLFLSGHFIIGAGLGASLELRKVSPKDCSVCNYSIIKSSSQHQCV